MGAGQQALISESGTSLPPGPSTISNLEIWFQATSIVASDGDQLSTWADSSGNARDATGVVGSGSAKPTYSATGGPNSKPAVRFAHNGDAGGPWFTLPNFLTGFSAGHAFSVVILFSDPPVSDAEAAPPLGDWGSTDDEYFTFTTDGKIYDAFGSTVRKTTVNPSSSLSSWRLYEERSAAGAWSNWLDGTNLFSTGTNTVGWSTAPFLAHTSTNNKRLVGYIAETFMYSRILTAGEITTIKTYITAKYGLTLA